MLYQDSSQTTRTHTRTHARKARLSANMRSWIKRINEAGVEDPVPIIVDEAVRITGGSESDRRIWLKICNRGVNTFLGVLQDFECSLHDSGNGTPRNLVTAFQARLNLVLPKPEGNAR